ncbi:hypothetical protein DSM100685_1288 [Bifidobacterium avesanii]|nr:hypothetical protein DSM100685_1288 [Bifidobacterium avesanii]
MPGAKQAGWPDGSGYGKGPSALGERALAPCGMRPARFMVQIKPADADQLLWKPE